METGGRGSWLGCVSSVASSFPATNVAEPAQNTSHGVVSIAEIREVRGEAPSVFSDVLTETTLGHRHRIKISSFKRSSDIELNEASHHVSVRR